MLLPKNTDDPDSPIWSVQTIAQFLRVNRALWQIWNKGSEIVPRVEGILLNDDVSDKTIKEIND